MNIKELRQNFTIRGLRGEMIDNFLFADIDEPEFADIDPTLINERGDIEEINSMTDAEVHAFIGLATAMNFLENSSGYTFSGTEGESPENWIGEREEWDEVNRYWIDKYPTAYHCLQVWVWS